MLQPRLAALNTPLVRPFAAKPDLRSRSEAAAGAHGPPRPLELDQIVHDYGPYLARVLPRMGVAEADFDDVMQELLLAIHRALPGFERRSSVKSWVYGICIRVCSNHRRRAYRRRERPLDEADEPAAQQTQERSLLASEALRQLDAALERLPDPQRQVFVLFEIEQLSMQEIAEALRCSKFTLYARLYAARRAVRAAMGDQPEPGGTRHV